MNTKRITQEQHAWHFWVLIIQAITSTFTFLWRAAAIGRHPSFDEVMAILPDFPDGEEGEIVYLIIQSTYFSFKHWNESSASMSIFQHRARPSPLASFFVEELADSLAVQYACRYCPPPIGLLRGFSI